MALWMLSGCTPHVWEPGPQASGDLNVISGQCKLMAYNMSGQYHPNAIIDFSSRQVYDACMESNGFVAR